MSKTSGIVTQAGNVKHRHMFLLLHSTFRPLGHNGEPRQVDLAGSVGLG